MLTSEQIKEALQTELLEPALQRQLEMIPLGRVFLHERKHSCIKGLELKYVTQRDLLPLYQSLLQCHDEDACVDWMTINSLSPLLAQCVQFVAQHDEHASNKAIIERLREQWIQRSQISHISAYLTAKTDSQRNVALSGLKSLIGKSVKQTHITDLANPEPPCEFLLENGGVAFIPKGDVVAITAKAKNGKTHLAAILTAAMIGDEGECCGLKRPEDKPPQKVLFIDTEQSYYSSDKMTARIHFLAGLSTHQNCDRLKTVNLRMMDKQERMDWIEGEIANGAYDAVVLDGIADIARDINNYQEADQLISELLMIVQSSKVSLITVLHENPAKDNDKMRGHIGTVLTNKAFEVLEVSRNKDTNIFTILCAQRREKDIPPFAFTFDEDDQLISAEPEVKLGQGQEQKGESSEERVNRQWAQMVTAFSDNYTLSHTREELIQLMAKKLDIKEGTTRNRIKFFYQKGWLMADGEVGQKGTRYYIAPFKRIDINQQEIEEQQNEAIFNQPPATEEQLPF